jgi:hypothetical protein
MAMSNKDPAETVTVTFDFTAITSAPSSPSVTVNWVAGTADSNPSAMLSGSPVVSGAKVLQQVIGGVDGATYGLRCEANAPDGSVYVAAGWIPVQTL